MTGPPGEDERLKSPGSVESPAVAGRSATPRMRGHMQVDAYPKEPVGHPSGQGQKQDSIRRQDVAQVLERSVFCSC